MIKTVAANISKVGIKREAQKGFEEAGPFRGIRVFSFPAPTTTGEFGRVKTVAGSKVTKDQGISGSHVELTFSFYASNADTAEGTLIDIMNMILDKDDKSGSGNITHEMGPQVIAKPSWTIYHDDGKGNHRCYPGFVANTCAITIDKTTGNITIEVSGFAFREVDCSAKTINYSNTVVLWVSRKAKLLIGSDILDNFSSATINFNCATEPKNTINDTPFPSDIEGDTMEVSVDLDGWWNEASGQLSDTLRTAFLNHTILDNLIIQMGPSQTNNGFKLTIPKFAIESHEAKSIEVDAELPQVLTLFDVNQGNASNNFKVEFFNTIDIDWDSY